MIHSRPILTIVGLLIYESDFYTNIVVNVLFYFNVVVRMCSCEVCRIRCVLRVFFIFLGTVFSICYLLGGSPTIINGVLISLNFLNF